MTREELEEQFSIECTTLDEEGYTVVKGTPMDIINWIADKFRLSDVIKSVCKHHNTCCYPRDSGETCLPQKGCFEK